VTATIRKLPLPTLTVTDHQRWHNTTIQYNLTGFNTIHYAAAAFDIVKMTLHRIIECLLQIGGNYIRLHSASLAGQLSQQYVSQTRPALPSHSSVSICWTGSEITPSVMDWDHSFPRNAGFWAELRNLPISAELLCFHGILRNLVLDGGKGTNTAYFDGVRATVLYVYMISPWNTWRQLGLWWQEYWKYWAELIWNITG